MWYPPNVQYIIRLDFACQLIESWYSIDSMFLLSAKSQQTPPPLPPWNGTFTTQMQDEVIQLCQ